MALLATCLVAATLAIVSLGVLRYVENEARESARAAIADVLAEQAEGFEPTNEAEFPDVVRVSNSGGAFDFGVFERSGELAFGQVFVGEVPVARVELHVPSGTINELRDPVTDLTLDDPVLREQVAALELVTVGVADDRLLVGAPSPRDLELSTAPVRRALLVAVPLVVLLFAAVTLLIVGRALRPVDELTSRVETISVTNLEERVLVPPSRDEIAHLAVTMNAMLSRIEGADARQREFSSDASHELRSPLTTIRAGAELIASDASDRTSRLGNEIVAEADRMDGLIDDLLSLARSEHGGDRHVALDLARLVREAASGRDHQVNAASEALVAGDEAQLTRMVTNLLDNADRHADSHVAVSVHSGDGTVCLTVEDDGDGIPPNQRERIFERFARLDDARSRSDGGAGLGLTIVRAIAERHGGSVEVTEPDDLPGARLVVELPACR